jgi:hypothetical protein
MCCDDGLEIRQASGGANSLGDIQSRHVVRHRLAAAAMAYTRVRRSSTASLSSDGSHSTGFEYLQSTGYAVTEHAAPRVISRGSTRQPSAGRQPIMRDTATRPGAGGSRL